VILKNAVLAISHSHHNIYRIYGTVPSSILRIGNTFLYHSAVVATSKGTLAALGFSGLLARDLDLKNKQQRFPI
jgi:hypothetical protein